MHMGTLVVYFCKRGDRIANAGRPGFRVMESGLEPQHFSSAATRPTETPILVAAFNQGLKEAPVDRPVFPLAPGPVVASCLRPPSLAASDPKIVGTEKFGLLKNSGPAGAAGGFLVTAVLR
jgi:hypothetical protein